MWLTSIKSKIEKQEFWFEVLTPKQLTVNVYVLPLWSFQTVIMISAMSTPHHAVSSWSLAVFMSCQFYCLCDIGLLLQWIGRCTCIHFCISLKLIKKKKTLYFKHKRKTLNVFCVLTRVVVWCKCECAVCSLKCDRKTLTDMIKGVKFYWPQIGNFIKC